MVHAMIDVSEHANRVLGIVKAKYGLRDKSEAIEKVVEEYEEEVLEPGLRPEFVEEVKRAKKHGKFRKVKRVEELFE